MSIFCTSIIRRFLTLSLVLSFAIPLAGCDLAKNQLKPDRSSNLEKQDYRDALAPRLPELDDAESDSSSIPKLRPYMASSSEIMDAMPLVTVSANQTVPLRDIIFELAKQAGYDLELDPRIGGAIIFTARNRPADEVIARISDVAGLRYKFENNVLRVELDTPFHKTYKIDYLNQVRSSSGGIRNDIGMSSGDGADTGSEFETLVETESDFWGELETNLAQILQNSVGNLRTSRNPRIVAMDQNPDVVALTPVSTASDKVQIQPPEAVLRVESLPVESDEGNSASSEGGGTFSLNRQGGMVNVYATEKVHNLVGRYLRLLKRSVTAQVLIEAKILEVSLSDEFVTGIDWRAIGLLSGEVGLNFLGQGFGILETLNPNSAPIAVGTTIATDNNFVVGYSGNDVQAVIEAISGFGTVKALASPRLTVLNNQSAVLNVATNRIFFELQIQQTQDGGGGNSTTVRSQIRNVPEGILVNVQPSINLEDGTVSMALRPTITRVASTVSDPGIDFVLASASPPIEGISSEIPELSVQELDTVIKVRSGQPVVMGGLLEDRAVLAEGGVPILSEMPLLGGLFRSHDDLIQKTELVIFLKATILDAPSDSIHDTDRDLYRKFSGDRRPFKL